MAATGGKGLRQRWVDARWQSPLVRERGRFVLRSMTRRSGEYRYRLRASDATVVLRHGLSDAFICHEVFRDPFYAPPPAVREVLPSPEDTVRVLDLGGNIGMFGLKIRSLYPRADIVAFEPDPDNARILRKVIALNGGARWEVVEACAAATDGELPFVPGQAGLSRVPEDETTATTTVPSIDVFPRLEAADLVKMDIEGGEWALLSDPRFAALAPPALLLEWHSYHCPADNPRRHATALLEAMGYSVLHETPPDVPDSEPFYGASALWAFRPTGARLGS